MYPRGTNKETIRVAERIEQSENVKFCNIDIVSSIFYQLLANE